jgi:uncharacterized protein (TIGR00369 family)
MVAETLPDAASQTSPFTTMLGFELLEWREDLARVALDLRPEHLNRNAIPHGGVILSLIDDAAGAAGNWCSVPGNLRLSVTVDLTVSFIARAAGGRLIATGRVIGQGRAMFFARTEVHDAAGTLVACGQSTHRRRRGSETTEGVLQPPAQDRMIGSRLGEPGVASSDASG